MTPTTRPLPPGWNAANDAMWRDLDNVSVVTAAIASLAQAGVQIDGLEVEAPTLQDLFIHLTGRELRE